MKKRIFVSFAMEDEISKMLFCGQAKNTRVTYEFVDMSVKTPWDSSWKTNCKTRIKGCDAMIVLISENTRKADGAIWEINCAKELGLKVRGIYIKNGNINNEGAIEFMNWITSEKGQSLIKEFGVEEYGQPLFIPNFK